MIRLLGLLATVAATITDCGPGRWPIEQLAFYPDPPTAGQDTVETIIYQVPVGESVTGGVASYTYTINGLPFTPSENDLCEDLACPIEGREEAYNQTSVSPWPSVSGKVTVRMEWLDEVGELLLCTNIVTRVAEQKALVRPYNWFKERYGLA